MRVFKVDETISDAPKAAVDEIKQFADAVNIAKTSLIASLNSFLTSFTPVMDKMHAANLSVYVSGMRNEFVTIPFDCFSDPMVEIATYAAGLGVDGIVTEFPTTASAYFSKYLEEQGHIYFHKHIRAWAYKDKTYS